MATESIGHGGGPSEPLRRSAKRRRVLKGGWLVLDDGTSSVRCFVKDISATGARIEAKDCENIPSGGLKLTLSDGETLEAEVVRRSGLELGVRFVHGVRPSLAPPPDPLELLVDRMEAMGVQEVLDRIEDLGLSKDEDIHGCAQALQDAYMALYARISAKVGPW
jgi:hypothetical protein